MATKKKTTKKKVSKKTAARRKVGASAKAMPVPTIVVTPEVKAAKADVALMVKALAQPKAWLSKPEIEDETTYADAGTVLAWTKRTINEADKKRKELVGPLGKVVKLINNEYKQVTAPTEKIQRHVTRLMSGYVQKQEDEAKAEVEVHAEKAEERGELDFAMDLRDSALIESQAPVIESVKAVARWHAKVEDLDILLSELVNGHAHLQALRPKLVDLVEKELGSLARATKRTDIGVPGAIGVKETSFNLKG